MLLLTASNGESAKEVMLRECQVMSFPSSASNFEFSDCSRRNRCRLMYKPNSDRILLKPFKQTFSFVVIKVDEVFNVKMRTDVLYILQINKNKVLKSCSFELIPQKSINFSLGLRYLVLNSNTFTSSTNENI